MADTGRRALLVSCQRILWHPPRWGF